MKLKSIINKRLSAVVAAGLLALAVGATGTTAAVASSAGASALTKSQSSQKKKELKKCGKKKNKQQQQKCKKQVNAKYKKISDKNSAPKGETKQVKLGDDYFAPSSVDLKVNDSINWSWADIGGLLLW